MELFRIGLLNLDTIVDDQEIHLGFENEMEARLWVLTNNLNKIKYNSTPMYCFLGAL